MFSNTCAKGKRFVVFILCGSLFTFLIQHLIFSSHKTDTTVIKMFQSTDPKNKQFTPVVVKPPPVPLPGPVNDGSAVTPQTPVENQPVGGINSPVVESLAHSPIQFQGYKSYPPATGDNFPIDLSKIPPALLQKWTRSLVGQLIPRLPGLENRNNAQQIQGFVPNSNIDPVMQGPFFNANTAPQGAIPKEYIAPLIQDHAPNGNTAPQMQGFITNTNIAPSLQGAVSGGNIAPLLPGAVPGENIAPPLQAVVPGGNIAPQIQGLVTNTNIAPLVQGAVPGRNIQPQEQGPVSNGNKVPQVVGPYQTSNIDQQIQDNVIPQMQGSPELPPPPGEIHFPNSQTQIDGGPETTILRWNGSGWTQLHDFCAGNMNLKRTVLRSPAGQEAIIYIHDLKNDQFVSGSLQNHGLWDLADVTAMINNLNSDHDLGFIDIGSHVGTFSLVAALMGKKVVAVDPLVSNVIRFCKSVQDNGFTDKVTIFYTALSDSYKKVSFQIAPGNIGGTRIKEAPANVNTSNVYDPDFIDTVRLDDLIPHIPFKRAFIKMDVEEHEYEVVTSGIKFFQEIDVRGILMEWMFHKTGKNGLKLRDFMLGLNFKPYFSDGSMELGIEYYQAWPNDVLWKKM